MIEVMIEEQLAWGHGMARREDCRSRKQIANICVWWWGERRWRSGGGWVGGGGEERMMGQ